MLLSIKLKKHPGKKTLFSKNTGLLIRRRNSRDRTSLAPWQDGFSLAQCKARAGGLGPLGPRASRRDVSIGFMGSVESGRGC